MMAPYQSMAPYAMQGPYPPPPTAPSGLGPLPGSPLLPTLHYQQTVMRTRTSSSGSQPGSSHWHPEQRCLDGSSSGGSGRWGSAGSGSSGGSRGPQQGGAGEASGWASRVSREAADVWPPRGVERSILSGVKGGRAAPAEKGDGDIVVYNAHLLLS